MFFLYLMSKWTYVKYFENFKMAAILRFGRDINGVMAISKFDLLLDLVT